MAHWDPLLLFVIQLLTGLHFGAIGMLSVAAVSTEYVNNLVAGFLTVGCIIGTGVIGLADAVALAGVNPEQTSVYESLLSTPVADTLLSFLLFFALGKVVFEIGPQDTRGNIARRTLADPALRAMNTFTRKFYSDLGGFRDFRIVEIEWSTSSTLHSMALMAASVAVAFFLCWYLNQIVGSVQSPWFIFSPSYWGVSGQRGNAKLHAQSKDADAVMVEQLQVQFSPTYFGLSFSALFFAVKDVSLSVSKGQVLSLLGRNGAGKSTTINCVTGLLRPSAGAVSCFGEGRPEHIQRMIGVTAQDDLTWPFLTAAEHIQLFATLKGLDKDMRQYAIDKLTMVGLEDHADQLVGEFSGGMRR
ncbi:P-loop containing nucleoside triphosphate hydrolase protein, partial [Blastocladiella britannica]